MSKFYDLIHSRMRQKSAHAAALSGRKCCHLHAAAITDVGCQRSPNEDHYLLGRFCSNTAANHSSNTFTRSAPVWTLAAVFDGMGGGDAGELASKAAAEAFLGVIPQLKHHCPAETVDTVLRKAFLQANNEIVSLHETCSILGTTGTVLCTDGTAFKIYHLGDSRAYLLRDKELFQLTRDQTLAQMKIELGMYDPLSPEAESEKHKLTDYIGSDWTQENLKPLESCWNEVHSGDLVLLCSDGLYDMCTDDQILQLLLHDRSVQEQAESLVDAANKQGGIDNITCILIQFT